MTVEERAPCRPLEGLGTRLQPEVFQVDAYPAMKPHAVERESLAAAGIGLRVGACTTTEELLDTAQGADVLWLYSRPKIGRRVLEALTSCRLVVRWGVGYEAVDVDAASDLGVAVANSPTWCTAETAEHTIGLLLSAARRIAWSHEGMRKGHWPRVAPDNVHRVHGRTLGLLGVGRIGAAVAVIAHGLGLRVIGYDPGRGSDELRADGVEPVSLDALLAQADYFSVHVLLSPSTRGLVDAAMLSKLKHGAILLNTSRGRVVDQAALLAALEAKTLAGAGLDVFEQEPLALDSPLRRLDQVVLTPHCGSVSAEAHDELRREMCSTTVAFLRDGWAPTIVNRSVRDRLRPSRTGAHLTSLRSPGDGLRPTPAAPNSTGDEEG
jgi:D-3-phosphoglycerate dehydrogenase